MMTLILKPAESPSPLTARRLSPFLFINNLSPYGAPQLSLYINIAVSLQQHIGHPSLLQLTLPASIKSFHPVQHMLDRAAPESNLYDHIPPGGCTCSPRPPPVGLIGAKLKGILLFFSPFFHSLANLDGEDSLIPKSPLSTGRAAQPFLSILFYFSRLGVIVPHCLIRNTLLKRFLLRGG
jgi:hypothetical protein